MKIKVITLRFIRAFVTGALSTMVLLTVGDISNWSDLASALNVLAISGVIGGINGVLQAGDKLLRWKK
jgi:hypothetical protein